ncbi:MAG: hypothetical protein L0Z51_01000 [Candidatus Latescibacteria bacterium]|nr:hypothetical protein [Candidatus Latescibacterota bacterium]
MRARSLVFSAAIALLVPVATHAQVRPFDRLDVGLYGAANVNRNDYHSYWDAGYSGAIDFVTPFYVGRASLLVRVGANDAVAGQATSGFTSVFGALGWRVGRFVRDDLRADLGLHVGLTEWIFSEEAQSEVRYELELGTEASLRADYEFARYWHAIAEASYQLTFTYERIELAYVSVGLARSFGAPGWIRSVFE